MLTRRTALAGLAGCSGGSFAVAGNDNNLIRYEQMSSAFIEPRNVHVWLPPGYHASTRRYPVIYMHDGQNVFSPAFAFRGQAWEIDAALSARSARDGHGAAIVVGIWNTPKRRSDYAPTAIEALLPEPMRARLLQQNGQAPSGDAYLRFIVDELKPLIDKSFRTLKTPKATTLMGASRGGMISLYGLCEYPHVFGSAACLSTHWLLFSAPSSATDPSLETSAITAALEAYLRAKLPNPRTHKIWMDHGTINLDSYYGPYQENVDRVFESKAWIKGQDFESRVYDGADHNEVAWRTRINDPLNYLLGQL